MADEYEQIQKLAKRYAQLKDYWSRQHEHTKELLRFADGDQWDARQEASRISAGRPTEVLNFVNTYLNRITNPYLQTPVGASIELPELDLNSFGVQTPDGFNLQDLLVGVVSEIEQDSGAKDAYFHAYKCAVRGGLGYWRIDRDYADDEGLEQKICIEMVLDPTKVLFDDASIKDDGSDARDAFYLTEIPEEQAEQEIPDRKNMNTYRLDIGSRGDCKKGFVPEVLYYERVPIKYWRFFLDDGSSFSIDEIPEGIYYDPENRVLTDGINVIPAKRRRMEKTICRVWRFVDSVLVEKAELPIRSIGVIRVIGDRVTPDANTQIYFTGATFWMMTSQRLVNYYANNELEVSGLAPRSPWVGSSRAFEGRPEWDDANRVAYSKLEYKDIDENGQPIPAPFRADNNAQTQPSMTSRIQAMQDMGQAIGITPEMLGQAVGANDSGKAVFLRNSQGEIPTIHYQTHFHEAIAYSADSLIDLMPIVYDTEREFILTNAEGKKVVITLNLADILTPKLRKYIKTKVSSGPSFESKRKEGLESLYMMAQTLGSVDPTSIPPFIKVMLKNSGAVGADEVLQGLAKINPVFADAQQADSISPEQVQQITAQYEEEIAGYEQTLGQMTELLRQMQNELQSSKDDNETKILIAEMNNQNKVLIEAMKAQADQQMLNKELIASIVKDALTMSKEMEKEDEDEDEEEDDRENRSENENQSAKNVNLETEPEDFNVPTLVRGGTEIFKNIGSADSSTNED